MKSRSDSPRLFLLGAGFGAPAGLPLAAELLSPVKAIANAYFRVDGFSHLEGAIEKYEGYLQDVDPTQSFDLEEFGAWLDWEHVLRLKGSDTFSEYGNEAGLQLRWAIGKVLHDRMPSVLPDLYLDFARRLNKFDHVLTLNYDLLLERALEQVGLPYRRYPGRYSEVYETYAVGDSDQPQELVIHKLHGSIDWTYFTGFEQRSDLQLLSLVDGPRPQDDPLREIAVISPNSLARYYSSRGSWWANPPLLLPPSTAKPLAASSLIPLWDGVGLFAYMLGGFTVIGCSLAVGDPYVRQLVHYVATDYVTGRQEGGSLWPQSRMKVVGLGTTESERSALLSRFRFMHTDHTDFIFGGFTPDTLDAIVDPI